MKKYFIKFLIAWGLNAYAIYLASMYIANLNYDSGQILALVALVLTIISVSARPFLKLLTLSFYIFAPLMFFVFYAAVLFGASHIVPGFDIGDLQTALFVGAITAVVNFVLSLIIR